MSIDKEKTGQGIDTLKERVLIPELKEIISSQFPEGASGITSVDIGTGNASSHLKLLEQLEEENIFCKNVVFIDSLKSIFGELLENLVTKDILDDHHNCAIIEPDTAFEIGPSLFGYEETADFITAQMVFHQIENNAELSLILCKLFLELKDNGCLYITDFHSAYFDYLLKNEPKKLIGAGVNLGGNSKYLYSFDSGGTAPVVQRSLLDIATILLMNGFHVTKVVQPSLKSVMDVKERYRVLEEENIPMFYILKAEKRPDRFLSYSSGIVKSIGLEKENSLNIFLMDDDTLTLPSSSIGKSINAGDGIFLMEVILPDGRTCCQVWVSPKEKGRDIWSVNFVSKLK